MPNEPKDGKPANGGGTNDPAGIDLDWTIILRSLGVTKPTILEAALAECQREFQVRERCYPAWVKDGKLAKLDARDRYNRLRDAIAILTNLLDRVPVPDTVPADGDGLPF